ncbi:MAG: hypothetical protein WBI17_14515 [Clostridiaceae bacterium]
MENYKKSLSTGINFMLIGLVLSVLVTSGLFFYSFSVMDNSDIGDFVHGVQTGLFGGIFFALILGIIKNKKALKNEASLKQSYIIANDERTKFIFSKMSLTAVYVEHFVLMLAIVISGFFSEIVCLTLLVVLITSIVTKFSLYIYYNKTI